MSTTHEPHEHTASPNEGRSDATVSAAEWIGIARAGFSNDSSSESMLWDGLDLDDPDDRRFGDYDLLERIGRGGMGVVFRAHQFSLGRDVALKFIVGGLASNTRAVAQFHAEARAAARLHHPHIVPVFEVGTVDGMHFFSMPLLRGQTLAERIADTRMPQKDSVVLLLKLSAAVEYAHSLGLLHLDLKPANVLFDEHAQPLIGDFGLARHMDAAGGVDVQDVSGTPAYMAPEQIEVGQIEVGQIESGQIDAGKSEAGMYRLDERTDVYALGAILFELL
ncbi:MAG TPA: serine/threonine-protein kinase, partial [Xanthomonadaceae bacterium]|nr:serine/threonine-protein kinase [Xanthomonadaceae bacterium]